MALIRPATGPTTRRTLLKRAGLAGLGLTGAGLAAGLGPLRAFGQSTAGDHQRAGAAAAALWRPDRRPSGQSGDPLGARRPAGPHAGRVGHERELCRCANGDRAGSARGHRFYRQARSRRPAGGPADRLPRQHGRPRRCRVWSASRCRAASARRRRRAGRSASSGLATSPARAGASIRDWGGMRIFETMRRLDPTSSSIRATAIYADNPIAAEQAMPDGGDLAERHDRGKGQGRRDPAGVPRQLRLQSARRQPAPLQRRRCRCSRSGTTTRSPTTGIRARISRSDPDEERVRGDQRRPARPPAPRAPSRNACRCAGIGPPGRISTAASPTGPRSRSFASTCAATAARTPRTGQARPGPETAFLGSAQIRWLKQALLASRRDLEGDRLRHADRPARCATARTRSRTSPTATARRVGRELEIADLLRFIRDNGIANVVWLTADVHYTAAHYYDPNQARFQEFAPFWEFVSGPLNAGTFGPGELDDTFGPQLVFPRRRPRARSTCRRRPACSSSARSTSTRTR